MDDVSGDDECVVVLYCGVFLALFVVARVDAFGIVEVFDFNFSYEMDGMMWYGIFVVL